MNRRKLVKFLPLALLFPSWSRGARSKAGGDINVTEREEEQSDGSAWPQDDTWVVGVIRDDPKEYENTWSVVGIYNDEQKAIKVCIMENHFVGPLVMNETNDDDFDFSNKDESPWPGMWFPYNFRSNPRMEEQIQKEKYS